MDAEAEILGGIKSVENRVDSDGPYVHGHFLLLCRRLDLAGLTKAWQLCSDAAALKIARRVIHTTSQPDLKAVRRYVRDPEKEVKLDDCLDELCKYL